MRFLLHLALGDCNALIVNGLVSVWKEWIACTLLAHSHVLGEGVGVGRIMLWRRFIFPMEEFYFSYGSGKISGGTRNLGKVQAECRQKCRQSEGKGVL